MNSFVNRIRQFYFGVGAFLFVMSFSALGDGLPAVPDVDPFVQLFALIKDFKTMGPFAIGMAVIVILMQVMKKFIGDFPYKRIVVTVLAVAYGLLMSLSMGMGVIEALILALVTGGGAVAIYEAIKGSVALVKK